MYVLSCVLYNIDIVVGPCIFCFSSPSLSPPSYLFSPLFSNQISLSPYDFFWISIVLFSLYFLSSPLSLTDTNTHKSTHLNLDLHIYTCTHTHKYALTHTNKHTIANINTYSHAQDLDLDLSMVNLQLSWSSFVFNSSFGLWTLLLQQ